MGEGEGVTRERAGEKGHGDEREDRWGEMQGGTAEEKGAQGRENQEPEEVNK